MPNRTSRDLRSARTHSLYLPRRFYSQARRACRGPLSWSGAPRSGDSHHDPLPKPHTQPQPPLPLADAAGALPHSAQTGCTSTPPSDANQPPSFRDRFHHTATHPSPSAHAPAPSPRSAPRPPSTRHPEFPAPRHCRSCAPFPPSPPFPDGFPWMLGLPCRALAPQIPSVPSQSPPSPSTRHSIEFPPSRAEKK